MLHWKTALALAPALMLAACGGAADRGAETRSKAGGAHEASDGSAYFMRTGAQMELSMESNPTTGYIWGYEASNPAVATVTAERYEGDPAPEGMTGVGGTQYYTVTALAPGSAAIRFFEARPWELEQGEPPIEERVIQITVGEF